MAFLSLFADAFSVNAPTAWPWELLINDTFTFIASVAWRIVFLTVCLKLILSPLDFYQRYKMRKNQLITQRLQSQMEKLEAQYSGNEKVLQQKKMELNRKSGMSMLSSCLPMIVTLVVFIWLWQSLNNIAQYNQFKDYVNMYNVYTDTYSSAVGDSDIDDYAANYRDSYTVEFESAFTLNADFDSASAAALTAAEQATETHKEAKYDALYKDTYVEWFGIVFKDYYARDNSKIAEAVSAGNEAGRMNAAELSGAYCRTIAQRETYNFYYGYANYEAQGPQQQGFVWIKNVWTADVPWIAPVKASESEFKSAVGGWATDGGKSDINDADLAQIVGMYDVVTELIHSDENNSTNGWLILPILALLLNIATQLIQRRQQKKSGQTQMTEGQTGCMMKAMMFVLPAMMFVFAIQYCAVFTLYMVTNALMSLVVNLVTTMLSKKIVKGEITVKSATEGPMVERYGRPDPNSPKSSGNQSSSNKSNKGKKR